MTELDFFFNAELPSEEEIISCWEDRTLSPVVSIICITFNHESYVREAMKGFLIQKTQYPFEIVVHDDASTDKTQEILNEFRIKYPNLITLVLQSENQYSKGKKPSLLALPKCKGRFVALCEGDDFWVDSNKLDLQVSKLESHPELNAVFSSCHVINEKKKKYTGVRNRYSSEERVFSVQQVIRSGGGFIHTPTLMLRRAVYDSLPDWFMDALAGDYFLQVFAATGNGILYLPSPTACYRKYSSASVTAGLNKTNIKMLSAKLEQEFIVLRKFLDDVDPQMEADVKYRSSQFAKEASSRMLLLGEDYKFLSYIKHSWEVDPKSSLSQWLLFRLRKFPSILRCLYILKSTVSNWLRYR